MQRKRCIAIAGSAANPTTLAHREFAEALTGSGLFDIVLWVPSGARSDKPDLIASKHRVRMAELTFNETWRKKQPTEFRLDLREAYRDMLPTIYLHREIQKEFPDAEIIFATGVDVLTPRPEFGGKCDVVRYWIDGESLMKNGRFAVFPRDGYPDPSTLQKEGKLPAHFLILDKPTSSSGKISSTDVRTRVARGESISGLVDPKVEEYIRTCWLYR